MPEWLDDARALTEEGSYRKALKRLRSGVWQMHRSDPETSEEAQALANRIADGTEGRLSSRATETAHEHRRRAATLAQQARDDEYRERVHRIDANVTAFVLLTAHDSDENSVPFDSDSFAPVTRRISEWRHPLHPCYVAGHTPVNDLGRITVDEAEQIRIEQLMRETVNEIVLQHAAAVENIATLRQAVPACLGYAIVNDDIRARELVSTLQRRSATSVELPSDAAMSTAILDAMEAAGPPADERELFKFVAAAAFHIGVGAGLQGVIDRSTPLIK